jgi:hypothetical protein
MPAAKLNLIIEKGADLDTEFVYKDPAGVPYDLTGYTARMHVRSEVGSDTVALDMTTENGYIELGDAAGTITFAVPGAITGDITIESGVYDLELIAPSGAIKRILKGNVKIDPNVTREE